MVDVVIFISKHTCRSTCFKVNGITLGYKIIYILTPSHFEDNTQSWSFIDIAADYVGRSFIATNWTGIAGTHFMVVYLTCIFDTGPTW